MKEKVNRLRKKFLRQVSYFENLQKKKNRGTFKFRPSGRGSPETCGKRAAALSFKFLLKQGSARTCVTSLSLFSSIYSAERLFPCLSRNMCLLCATSESLSCRGGFADQRKLQLFNPLPSKTCILGRTDIANFPTLTGSLSIFDHKTGGCALG